MIGRLFKQEQTLCTPLSEAEVFNQLQKHSVGGKPENENIKPLFRGKFDREKQRFSLEQIFDLGPHNQIRPELKGDIVTSANKTIVHLNIELPKYLAVLFDFALLLNVFAFIAFLFLPLPKAFPREFMLYGIPIGFMLTLLIGKGFFNSKYSDCEKLIRRIIQAE